MKKSTPAKNNIDIRQMFLAGVPKILNETKDNKHTQKPNPTIISKTSNDEKAEQNSMKKKRKAEEV